MSEPVEIAAAIARATEHLTEHPEEAAYSDSEAVATLQGGLRVTVRDPAGRSVETDMPKGVGGGDTAPSAGWLFRAALAACDATLIGMRAAMLGVELTDVRVTIDSESNDYGILGIDESVPAGPLRVGTRIRVAAKDTDEQAIRDLVEWAIAHCPVCDATKRSVPMRVQVDVG